MTLLLRRAKRLSTIQSMRKEETFARRCPRSTSGVIHRLMSASFSVKEGRMAQMEGTLVNHPLGNLLLSHLVAATHMIGQLSLTLQ